MIYRISVTVTDKGLKFNASDHQGLALEQIWLNASEVAGSTGGWVPRAESLSAWHLSAPLDRLAHAMIPLAARLVRSLRFGRLPGMRSLTFDVIRSGVDCHICLSSFDEVLLHYPLPCSEGANPVVRAGRLSALPLAFLNLFNQAVRTHFSALAEELDQPDTAVMMSVGRISKEDAA